MDNTTPVSYIVALALVGILSVSQYLQARRRDIKVPAVGPAGTFTSYISGFKWLFKAPEIIAQGYAKYKDQPFKIAQLDRWHVMVSGQKLVEELRKAPDDQLSFEEAVGETLAIEYTLGPAIHHNMYHVPIIRSQLTRNLGALFDDVRDEIAQSFNEIIPPTDDWVGHPALDSIMRVVCRTSNRIFVGLPLCRDPDYGQLNIEFTIKVVKAAAMINLAPAFMRPLVGRLLSSVPKAVARAIRHLRPIIEERQRSYAEYGKDYPDKPNDMLSWLMDEAVGEEKTTRALTLRILTINFAAIHTSSMSFTHALYHLAARPEYLKPMREEVEAIIKQEGWTKIAMTKMRKVDSFLKEAQRYNGLGVVSMTRKALQDFTFSDGTFIPAGTFVSVAAGPTHMDDAKYDNADKFDGFRFANMRDEDGEGVKHQMVSTNPDYLPFGHGRHACPGRFFAANELKAMMAYIVITYDVKMANEGVRPADSYFATACIPDTKAEVLFRRRQS